MLRAALIGTAAIGAMTSVAAAEQGDWIVRGRAILVSPQEDASGVEPAFPNGSVEVEDAVVPELDFTYFLTRNVGVELILATSPHDLEGTGDLEGLGKIGDVWALPPTLTLQYHFQPEAKVRPYVGVGFNYTIFYNEDATSSLNNAIGDTSISLDESFGVAVQAGVDVDVSENWFVNADIKWIQIDTTATLNTGGSINKVDVELDPIVAGIGLGRRF
ncbi:OmpW/AlkL family protein [Parvularcula marina]|uniref:OmpW family protein n=1 Tax=Parvularcula marina TaxID=2292771 RepID=A0A371R7L2_9PROT|nr:OmpW family protein [Parvularcula marina]RFB01444.1 OmpW family protein [Parvularcula marina]